MVGALRTHVRPLLPKRMDAAGLGLAGVVVALAFAVHERYSTVSPLVVSVAAGVLLTNAGLIDHRMRAGLAYASKRLLRVGVVLLGTQLALDDLVALGGRGLLVVVTVVLTTFFGTQWLGRRLGLSAPMSLLVGTGFSICGASAVAAMEPLAGAEEEEVTYAIAMVTLCGSLAIVVLPLVNRLWLKLDDDAFGSWVGASVHDVAQTVAAASTKSDEARAAAVVVKLTRVVMLAPMVAGVSLWRRRQHAIALAAAAEPYAAAEPNAAAQPNTSAESNMPSASAPTKRPPVLPLFVAGFLVAIAVRSLGWIPDGSLEHLKTTEQVLLGMALVGLGAGVQWSKLRRVGGAPLVLALASWAFIAALSLAGVVLTH